MNQKESLQFQIGRYSRGPATEGEMHHSDNEEIEWTGTVVSEVTQEVIDEAMTLYGSALIRRV
jgi:hypothetical protein